MRQDAIGLYIHIPFCETRCSYCSFNTYARLEALIPSYVDALVGEIHAWGERLGHPRVRTVFLGGGTPSWLPAAAIESILGASRSAFPLQADTEISAEANPGDTAMGKLLTWRQAGINRVSMGVQSFSDPELRLLTRRHTAGEAVEAVGRLREAGFGNASIDLMYGLPCQTLEDWRRTLDQALSLRLPHMSMYGLTVDEGTPLWKRVREGRVPSPDPDLAADMYQEAEARLEAAGYRHYEISNWALPGYECRHNLVYWHNEPFLGVGPGAHSYLGGERFWNIKSPAQYVRRLSQASAPGAEPPVVEKRQPVTPEEELSETLILRLRLDEGVDLDALAVRYDGASLARFGETLQRCVGLGLLRRSGSVFCLTPRGRLLSNEVFVRLLPDS